MADENVRFTTWLSPSEMEGVRQMAAKNGTSVNYIVRVAIRQMLGLPILMQMSGTPVDSDKVQ